MGRTRILWGVLAAVLLAAQAGFAADILSGTWEINLAKSKYSPANLTPQSGNPKLDAVPGGVKAILDGFDSQGRKTRNEYLAQFDNKDVPVKATVGGKTSPEQDSTA